jgi:hypothetical protein
MGNEKQGKVTKKGFFARLIDKWDKRLEEKAKCSCCGGGPDKDKGKTCC